jgi:hypothetical protein
VTAPIKEPQRWGAATQWLPPKGKSGNTFPFDPTKAKSLGHLAKPLVSAF